MVLPSSIFAPNYGGSPWVPQTIPTADDAKQRSGRCSGMTLRSSTMAPNNQGVTLANLTAGAFPSGHGIIEYDDIRECGAGSPSNHGL